MKEILLLSGKLNTRQEPLRLGKITGDGLVISTLVNAINVDFDNNGFTQLREGRSQVIAGAGYHSFWSDPRKSGLAFIVQGAVLSRVNADYSTTQIATLSSDNRGFYLPVNDELLFMNGTNIGWLDGSSFDEFDPQLSEFEQKMPAGQYATMHRGCLVVACKDILYVSKPHKPEIIDERYCMFPMAGYIRMLGGVNTGIWTGTEKGIGFITGDHVDNYKYDSVTNHACPDGAFLLTTEENDQKVDNLVAWISEEGFCQGRENGTYRSHSHPNMALPTGSSGVLYERFNNGIRQYVAVVHQPESQRTHTGADIAVNTVTV